MLAEKIRLKIGEKLKENQRSVNLAEKMAGLPKNTIRNILEGQSLNPKIETLYAIAKFLNCSLDELTGHQSEPATKQTPKLEWDKTLLINILEYMSNYIESSGYKVTLDQVLFLQEQAYIFLLTKREKMFDKGFIEWLIDSNLNKQ